MKKQIHKISILFILTLCISLSGCSKNASGDAAISNSHREIDSLAEDDPDTSPVSEAPSSVNAIKGLEPMKTLVQTNNQSITNKDDNSKYAIQVAMQTFNPSSELVYATANVNIRSSSTTKANNIITVLKKGSSIKRIGVNKEWSKVQYKKQIGYIKTAYLKKSKSLTKEAATRESFVAELDIASDIKQLVCVIGNGGSDAVVSYHVKDKDGKWREKFSIDGDVGKKGISYSKQEGDSRTPAGLYSFTLAFGIKSDPGTKLTYRKITEYDYWVDDVESPYYDTWVNSKDTRGNFSSEHLIDHNPSYNYAMHINYNPDNTPGLGSAIFLHCYNGGGRTTGCVAISEKYMKLLVQELDSSAMILIVPDRGKLSKY